MSLTSEESKKYTQKLLLSRFRILNRHGFYGLLLMHMRFGLDEDCQTAYTDGYQINFSPKFLDELSKSELDFVMMHEIMHVVFKHCFRGRKTDPHLFNIACDIVVNSNILYSNNMDLKSITLEKYGESMHLTPDKKEGYLYTAEEVYNMLVKDEIKKGGKSNVSDDGFDDHSHWEEVDDDFVMDEWERRVINAGETVKKRGETGCGKFPLGVERLINDLKNATVDWKTLLNDFISLEIGDYSFTPPDRRLDGPFYMPDFNELVETTDDPKEILFMVDTSGSVNSEQITQAYSEIKGALDQFTSLEGYLGFFDTLVYEPKPFSSIEDVLEIIPKGGGGTSFFAVFSYVQKLEVKPKALVILTDGYAQFPPENVRNGIPVIWIINNDNVTPPWGEVARMKL